MHGCRGKRLMSIWIRPLFTVAAALFLIGCAGGSDFIATPAPADTPEPTPVGPKPISKETPFPTVDPTEALTPAPTPTMTVATGPAPTPTMTVATGPAPTPKLAPEATATPTPAQFPVILKVLSPQDKSGIELAVVRVSGATRSSAAVTVNGTNVNVTENGTFLRDLTVKEGVYPIEVVASDVSGGLATENLEVLYIPSTAALPLSVFYPYGDEVSQPTIEVIGATRPDAIVGVNGNPVDLNAFGIFSTTVPLQEGVNLVEVVAINIEDDVNYRSIVVFYIP